MQDKWLGIEVPEVQDVLPLKKKIGYLNKQLLYGKVSSFHSSFSHVKLVLVLTLSIIIF